MTFSAGLKALVKLHMNIISPGSTSLISHQGLSDISCCFSHWWQAVNITVDSSNRQLNSAETLQTVVKTKHHRQQGNQVSIHHTEAPWVKPSCCLARNTGTQKSPRRGEAHFPPNETTESLELNATPSVRLCMTHESGLPANQGSRDFFHSRFSGIPHFSCFKVCWECTQRLFQHQLFGSWDANSLLARGFKVLEKK